MILTYYIILICIKSTISIIQEPTVIKYNKILYLICINENKTQVTWYKNNKEILFSFTRSPFLKKFRSFVTKNKYFLTINNYDSIDLTFNYTCSADSNYTFTKLNNKIIEQPLTNKNIIIKKLNNLKYFTFINITFLKIFPIPECILKKNSKKNLNFINIKNKQLDKLHFKSELIINVKKLKCKERFLIQCNFLGQDIIIFDNINIKKNCITFNFIQKFSICISIISLIITISLIYKLKNIYPYKLFYNF